MALADRTRLRILNLMRGGEVSVFFFTEALGVSQPKISRHLAYLRRAGLVDSRRDGKWIYYSISTVGAETKSRLLDELFAWMDEQAEMLSDRERYEQARRSPASLLETPRTQMKFVSASAYMNVAETVIDPEPAHNEIDEFLL